ncbi:MAG: hypothetical protein KGP29_01330 [Proteobacteria bacterium]|nr:hypothetical protein [Pseudomonadota bacterium]
MTKNSSDSALESFLSKLEEPKPEEIKIENSSQRKNEKISFAGNVVEIAREEIGRNSKLPNSTAEHFDDVGIKNLFLLRKASQIFSENFFTFCRVNFVITSIFLLSIFALIFWQSSLVPNLNFILQNHQKDYDLIAISILISWIFFSWLRASYSDISSNYFEDKNSYSPIFFGAKKLFSFLVLEMMQIVLLLIGFLLLFLAPFFGARYFLSLPVMIENDNDSISSMLISAKLSELWMIKVMSSMIFISFFVISSVFFLYFYLSELISDRLILLSLIFFIFSFFLLPIHSCFRFVLYKKLQSLTKVDTSEEFSTERKMFFVISRFTFLLVITSSLAFFFTSLTTIIFNENSNLKALLSVNELMNISGLSSFFENLLDTTRHYPAATNN